MFVLFKWCCCKLVSFQVHLHRLRSGVITSDLILAFSHSAVLVFVSLFQLSLFFFFNSSVVLI